MQIIYLPAAYKQGYVSFQQRMAEAIMDAPWQQRQIVTAHPLLMQAAQRKADNMVRLRSFAHTLSNGETANENVRAVGFVLPSWYPQKGNQVESFSVGVQDPVESANLLFKHATHTDHMAGTGSFYSTHDAIGVGYSITDEGRAVFVFISAPNIG